jgi:hypothetical protein
MSCAITKGRGIGCKAAYAGIKNVYIEFFKFEVKGGQTSLETSVTSSRENGTTFYESTLNITFQNLDVATQEEIKLLNRGRAHYVVELYPDGTGTTKYLLVGKDNGAEVTGGTIVTGAAAGDLQGFTLTATASEVNPPFFATAPDESATTPITPA